LVQQSKLGGTVRVIDNDSTTARVVLDHDDISVGAAVTNGVTGLAMTVRNSKITSTNDGIAPTGGAHGPQTLIEYNKITRDGTRIGTQHMDGIQFWQGGNAVIQRNWIDGWANSAIIIKSDLELRPGDGPISNIVIQENYLENSTSYFTLYVRDGGKGRPRFITVQNNAFGRHGMPISSGSSPYNQATFVHTEKQRSDAIAAGNPQAAEWIVWSGNYYADDGTPVAPIGGWKY
jgi:hypothetical protein